MINIFLLQTALILGRVYLPIPYRSLNTYLPILYRSLNAYLPILYWSLQKCAKRFLLFFLLFCHATSPLQKCAKLMALSEVEPPQAPLRGACGSMRLQRHAPSPSASLALLAPSLLEHHARPVQGVVSRAYFEP